LANLLESFFPPKLFVLVDCDVVLLRPMKGGEGEDGDGGDGGRVTSVFVMTLSCHFGFRDKTRLSGRTCRLLLLPSMFVWSLIRSGWTEVGA